MLPRHMPWLVLPGFIILLLAPDTALAWGPATHLELGSQVIRNLGVLPLPLQELLRAHPLDFLYGMIAADIVVGKKFTHYLSHCHRWSFGLEVLGKAASDSQRSFAWGYLGHLAADVVAHNYFVPFKTILSFNTKGHNHAYWEVRFDTHADEDVWTIPVQISRKMHLDNDELLKSTLARTLFSFRTNKAIFNGIMLAGRFKNWHDIIGEAMATSPHVLDPVRVKRYKKLSLDSVLAFLIDREDAFCFTADPTGNQSLKAARVIRAHLRSRFKRGKLSEEGLVEVLEKYRPHLESSIYAKPNSGELVEAALDILDS